MAKEMEAAFWELYKEITDKVIAFCKEYDVKADYISLDADGVESSIEHGHWTAATDCSFALFDKDELAIR